VYCPNCACEFPTVAKFCVKCGSLTGFHEVASSLRPPVPPPLAPAPVIRPERARDQTYCGKCGTKAVGGNLFCTGCGSPLHGDDEPLSSSPPGHPYAAANGTGFSPVLPTPVHHDAEFVAIQGTLTTAEVSAALRPTPDTSGEISSEPASSNVLPGSEEVASRGMEPPVVRLVLLILGAMLMVSVIAFSLADDIARSALPVSAPLMAAAFVLPFLLYHTVKTLGTLKHLSVLNEAIGHARGRLLRQSIVFGVLFTIIASAAGYGIGTSGNETQRLLRDEEQYTEIGNRISYQRNSAASTVPSQIAMYNRLEPDVRAFAWICATLHGEFAVFDRKYPNQHQTTEDSLHNIDNGAKRATLLLQEIEVAKRIGSLEVTQQLPVWKSDMLPLLDQEDSLN